MSSVTDRRQEREAADQKYPWVSDKTQCCCGGEGPGNNERVAREPFDDPCQSMLVLPGCHGNNKEGDIKRSQTKDCQGQASVKKKKEVESQASQVDRFFFPVDHKRTVGAIDRRNKRRCKIISGDRPPPSSSSFSSVLDAHMLCKRGGVWRWG